MSARGLLDADMHAVGGWIAEGVRWWTDELRALVPARWRSRQAALPAIDYDPETGFGRSPAAGRGARVRLAGSRAIVMLPEHLCLRRTIVRPFAGDRDLPRMLTLDQDRIMPLPAEALLVAGRTVGASDAGGRATIVVAGLPVDRATALAEAIRDAGVVPARVLAQGPEGAVDLLPALVERGMVTRSRGGAAAWWTAVAILFLVNIGLSIWRDVATTDRLDDIVTAQQPAVAAAHRIARRLTASDRIVEQVAAVRTAREPLAILARLSTAMPDRAWVQRLAWQGDTLKLTGYRAKDSDVAAALRQRGGFADVRYADGAAAAEDANGQPFEIVASLRRR